MKENKMNSSSSLPTKALVAGSTLLAGLLILLGLLAGGCGAPQTRLVQSPVRVTEVHYNPSVDQGKAEFIEISNLSKEILDLSDWTVTGAGRVPLPKGTTLEPRTALVICKDKDAVEKLAGGRVAVAATFTGKLKGKGEVIRIENPQGNVADEAGYDSGFAEVEKANGSGLSLHRVSTIQGTLEKIWRAASPSPGRLVRGARAEVKEEEPAKELEPAEEQPAAKEQAVGKKKAPAEEQAPAEEEAAPAKESEPEKEVEPAEESEPAEEEAAAEEEKPAEQ